MKALRSFYLTLICLTMPSITMADGHSSSAPSGQEVFETSCANCHDSFIGGFFSGAPALGDKADWETLILKGVDGLIFVADSQSSRAEANIESMHNLYENL